MELKKSQYFKIEIYRDIEIYAKELSEDNKQLYACKILDDWFYEQSINDLKYNIDYNLTINYLKDNKDKIELYDYYSENFIDLKIFDFSNDKDVDDLFFRIENEFVYLSNKNNKEIFLEYVRLEKELKSVNSLLTNIKNKLERYKISNKRNICTIL